MLNDLVFRLFSGSVKVIAAAFDLAFWLVPLFVAILLLNQWGWL